jgi:hypothetical protein
MRQGGSSGAGEPWPSAAEEPFVEIAFDLTRDDFQAASVEIAETDPTWTQTASVRRRAAAGDAALMSVPIVLTFIGAADLLGWRHNGDVGPVLIGAAVSLLWFVHRSQLRTHVRASREHIVRQVRAGHFDEHLGPQRIVLGGNGVYQVTGRCATLWNWSAIRRIDEASTAVRLVTVTRSQFIIPNRVFADPAGGTAFAAKARRLQAEAGATEADRVRALLADQDLRCPDCGYNLRGNPGQNCPECGRPLDADGLKSKL